MSLLDKKKRAILWSFSSFLQILKNETVSSIDDIKRDFNNYFVSDDGFFENNFMNIFSDCLNSGSK